MNPHTPQEKNILESLFFVIGLIVSIKFDPQDVKDSGEVLRTLAIEHYSRLLNYHGDNKSLVEGRSEALNHLATLDSLFPGLQDEVVSHTLKQLG